MAINDILVKDKFRELARRYTEQEPDLTLPEVEIERPGPDYQGFFRRLEENLNVSRAATGVSRALGAAERARRQQAELEQLSRQWGSYDLSGINAADYYESDGRKAGGTSPFGSPLRGKYNTTSGYGPRKSIQGSSPFHTGQDFGAPAGTPIYATHDGVVRLSSGGAYGNMTTIVGGGGYSSRYAHQSRFAVKSGQRVRRGQLIGYVGATGRATGPHLHYEVWLNGSHKNPRGYL